MHIIYFLRESPPRSKDAYRVRKSRMKLRRRERTREREREREMARRRERGREREIDEKKREEACEEKGTGEDLAAKRPLI